jgi:hypothetical protein
MFYLYENIRVAARSGALDRTALNHEVCDRAHVTALEFHGAGMKRWRLGRRVKTGLGGLRLIAYDALERTCVRAQASAAATAL